MSIMTLGQTFGEEARGIVQKFTDPFTSGERVDALKYLWDMFAGLGDEGILPALRFIGTVAAAFATATKGTIEEKRGKLKLVI